MKKDNIILIDNWIPKHSELYVYVKLDEKEGVWEKFWENNTDKSVSANYILSKDFIEEKYKVSLPHDVRPEFKGFRKELSAIQGSTSKKYTKTVFETRKLFIFCICKNLDEFVYKDGGIIKVPFSKYLQLPESMNVEVFSSFTINKASYINQIDLICRDTNYFMEFYDKDNELIMALFKLKSLIDNRHTKDNRKRPAEIPPVNFKSMLFSILFTNTMLDKIDAMTDDNYILNIDANPKYETLSDQTKFNDRQTKVLMKISTIAKFLMIPLMHYLFVMKLDPANYLYSFYETAFEIGTEPGIDLLNKFYVWVNQYVDIDYNKSEKYWTDKIEVYGENKVMLEREILRKHLIVDSLYKYTFCENPSILNYVIIGKQIGYVSADKFKHNLIDLTPEGGSNSNELTKLDRLLMANAKVDESMIVISDSNIESTIAYIMDRSGVGITHDEIEFYIRYYKVRQQIQTTLMGYFYAKDFKGFGDINMLTRRQYIKLMCCMKRRLLSMGFKYLPYIVSSNTQGKPNSKIIQNTKFRERLENTPMYNILNEEKFSVINKILNAEQDISDKLSKPTKRNEKSRNPQLKLMSSIMNTKFTYVDYTLGESSLGVIIELNESVVCDEFLKFLDLI